MEEKQEVKKVFDNDKYIKRTAEEIRKRIEKFPDRLYIEVGGKLFDDYHASRCIPGFRPDNKINIIKELKDDVEVIIVVSNEQIESKKIREDKGLFYTDETIELIKEFKELNIPVSGVVINKYIPSINAKEFEERLLKEKVKVYHHTVIPGYPKNIDIVVSENGFGKNEYIKTEKHFVILSAPGPGAGKMTVCLSQLYHEAKQKKKVGYAKLETFPVAGYNPNHPINIAYESATADIKDKVLVDSFHLEATGIVKTSYNRDLENFPVLENLLRNISKEKQYNSPTEMGINLLEECILDEEAVKKASYAEIVRRYFKAAYSYLFEKTPKDDLFTHITLMNKAGINKNYLDVRKEAVETRDRTGRETVCIFLNDGTKVFGKETNELEAGACAILNTLKLNTNILSDLHIIDADIVKSIKRFKDKYSNKNKNKLSAWESVLVLVVLENNNKLAKKALKNIKILEKARLHSTYILSKSDIELFKNLGIDVTMEEN